MNAREMKEMAARLVGFLAEEGHANDQEVPRDSLAHHAGSSLGRFVVLPALKTEFSWSPQGEITSQKTLAVKIEQTKVPPKVCWITRKYLGAIYHDVSAGIDVYSLRDAEIEELLLRLLYWLAAKAFNWPDTRFDIPIDEFVVSARSRANFLERLVKELTADQDRLANPQAVAGRPTPVPVKALLFPPFRSGEQRFIYVQSPSAPYYAYGHVQYVGSTARTCQLVDDRDYLHLTDAEQLDLLLDICRLLAFRQLEFDPGDL